MDTVPILPCCLPDSQQAIELNAWVNGRRTFSPFRRFCLHLTLWIEAYIRHVGGEVPHGHAFLANANRARYAVRGAGAEISSR